MSKFILLIALFGSMTAVAASQSVISPPSKKDSGCDLSVPGIKKALFLPFFKALQSAAREKNPRKLSGLMNYPLLVNFRNGSQTIQNQKQFVEDFAKIFSNGVETAITEAQLSLLFCNYQGVMLGETGQVWIGQSGKKVGVETLNVKDRNR